MSMGNEDCTTGVGRRIATSDVPRQHRNAYWHELVCSLYVPIECEGPADAELFGEVEFTRVGEVDVTYLSSNTPRVRHTQAHVARGSEAFFLVLLLTKGRGAICQDGRMAVLSIADLVVVDTTRPYDLLFEEHDHEVTVLRVEHRRIVAHIANMESLCATTIPGRNGMGRLVGSMAAGLRTSADSLSMQAAFAASDALLKLVGAAMQDLPEAQLVRPRSMAAYHATRVKAYIEENIRNPQLSIASIAAAMKISPDHLSRIFRAESVSPSRLIWLRRLEGTGRDLLDPRLRTRAVSEIAYSWGYSDAAHFSRSFKEQYGMSPRDWRLTADG